MQNISIIGVVNGRKVYPVMFCCYLYFNGCMNISSDLCLNTARCGYDTKVGYIAGYSDTESA